MPLPAFFSLLALATSLQTPPLPVVKAPAVLEPEHAYFSPNQPLHVQVAGSGPMELTLADFIGRATSAHATVSGGSNIDLRQALGEPLSNPGTYVVSASAHNAAASVFVGTPLVIEVLGDSRRGAPSGPMVIRIEPLRYAAFDTDAGQMRICFYYDTAPNTVGAIASLIAGGFYDGREFFRIEPGFIIQTGDPREDGTGGPGFTVDGEFSDRQHLEGVLSLARATDPNEAPGLPPRAEFANSGGSQFFICLDYARTQQLDRRYAAFARIVDGLDALRAIARAPLEDRGTRPRTKVHIKSARLMDVTPGDNPYSRLRVVDPPTNTPLSPLRPIPRAPTSMPLNAGRK